MSAIQEKSANHSEDISTPATIEYILSPQFFRVYTNHIEMAMSPWDITLNIAQMVAREGTVVKIERLGSLVMNPGHAKALLGALIQSVQQYEAQFGEINLDKIVQANAKPPISHQ